MHFHRFGDPPRSEEAIAQRCRDPSATLCRQLPLPQYGASHPAILRVPSEALAERDRLIASVATQSYAPSRSDLTVGQAVDRWLEHRRTAIKPGTWSAYKSATSYIVRPILVGTPRERRAFTETGRHPDKADFLLPLESIRIADLTTGAIRSWHAKLVTHVSSYTTNLAQKFLRAALVMAAEDFQLRVPPMPSSTVEGGRSP